MSQFSPDAAVPASLPVLSRGKHRNPTRGACFMEYTALLAGEPHTDQPACVDEELAAVLRGVNDKLTDVDRPLLVPLLGRAIGLTAGPRPTRRVWRRSAADRRRSREELVRFADAVGAMPTPSTNVWSGGGEEVSWLFWDLMDQPNRLRTSADYVRRLVERLYLLHECYERAMDDLGLDGLPRDTASRPARAAEGAPVAG
jgi:hypothetical protein